MKRFLLTTLTLVASASSQAQTPFFGTATAGKQELTQCNAPPTKIKFARESTFNGFWHEWKLNRYVQKSTDSGYMKMVPSAGENTAINPAQDINQDFGYFINCTPKSKPIGTGTQWLSFQFKTTNYYSTLIGSSGNAHLPVLLRAKVNAEKQGKIFYDGLGVAIYKENMYYKQSESIYGERFYLDQLLSVEGTQVQSKTLSPLPIYLPMADNVTYTVTIHAGRTGVAIWIYDPRTGVTRSTYMDALVPQVAPDGRIQSGPPVTNGAYTVPSGTGIGFAAICGAVCTVMNNQGNVFHIPYSIEFTGITTGWF